MDVVTEYSKLLNIYLRLSQISDNLNNLTTSKEIDISDIKINEAKFWLNKRLEYLKTFNNI